MGSEHDEAEAGKTSESQERVGQPLKLPEEKAAELRGRMRNLSESALRSRGVKRPAGIAKLPALSELQASAQSEAPEARAE